MHIRKDEMFIAKSKKKRDPFLSQIWSQAQEYYCLPPKNLYKRNKCSNFKEKNKKAAKRTRNKNKLYIKLLEQNIIELSKKLKIADDIIETQKI